MEHSRESTDQGLHRFPAKQRGRPVRTTGGHHAVHAAHEGEPTELAQTVSSYAHNALHAATAAHSHREPTETVQDCAGVLIRVHSQPRNVGEPDPYARGLEHVHSFGNFSLTSGVSGSDAEDERPQRSAPPSAHAESPRPTSSHYDPGSGSAGEATGADYALNTPCKQTPVGVPDFSVAVPSPWCLDWVSTDSGGLSQPTFRLKEAGDAGLGDTTTSAWYGEGRELTWTGAGGAEFAVGGSEDDCPSLPGGGKPGDLTDAMLFGTVADVESQLCGGA